MTRPEIPSEVTFATTCFWVKAYDVLGKKQTTSFTRILASNIGELVSCDEATTKGVDKALCFCIDINISKPLRRGIDKTGNQNETPNATESSSILINVDATVTTGNRAFKRKQKDASLQKKSDYKIRVVDVTPEISSSLSVSAEDSFIDNGIYDLGYLGYDYAWCNYQQNGVVVEERLDHYCANMEWSLPFPNALVSHIDSDISDHLPILPKCNHDSNGPSYHTQYFQNMWFTHTSCKAIVASAWSSSYQSDVVDNLLSRLANCLKELTRWNYTTFRHVDNGIGTKKSPNNNGISDGKRHISNRILNSVTEKVCQNIPRQ
ncbi:hypothetical protein Cgig2_023761 [Carnegiea gigantea]|uniref:Uncharacterized protein n=1 Tax=Carnegiea gigantea TaxID=171969 RepID=A0A9Q1KE00_9CARY|nr:hypothetical protein Cgig2_023761 [Carnegiea gigantea]